MTEATDRSGLNAHSLNNWLDGRYKHQVRLKRCEPQSLLQHGFKRIGTSFTP